MFVWVLTSEYEKKNILWDSMFDTIRNSFSEVHQHKYESNGSFDRGLRQEKKKKNKNVHSVIQAGFITGLVWLCVGLIERKKSNGAEKRMTDSKHRRINVIVITPNKSLGVSWRWWPLLWTSFIFVRHVMSLFYTASIAAFCIFSSVLVFLSTNPFY